MDLYAFFWGQDYFDIIETPMDFGTICSDLEHGRNYVNSEEVFRDVQFIWENCYRYNNKGDYILNLMNRVKKNFTKYWMAAGLHCELSKRNSGECFHFFWILIQRSFPNCLLFNLYKGSKDASVFITGPLHDLLVILQISNQFSFNPCTLVC